MHDERRARIELDAEHMGERNAAMQELIFLSGVKDEAESSARTLETCQQQLQAARLEHTRLQEVLRDHDLLKREVMTLKADQHAADQDRIRLEELEILYTERNHAAVMYKHELTAALLEVRGVELMVCPTCVDQASSVCWCGYP